MSFLNKIIVLSLLVTDLAHSAPALGLDLTQLPPATQEAFLLV